MSNQGHPAAYAVATQLTTDLVHAPTRACHEAEQRVSGAIQATGPFPARWSAALNGAASPVRSAAGRALLVHLLCPSDVAVATKRQLVGAAGCGSDQEDTIWADAAMCRRWLHSVPAPGAAAQREALAHLLHPRAFEPIASPTVRPGSADRSQPRSTTPMTTTPCRRSARR